MPIPDLTCLDPGCLALCDAVKMRPRGDGGCVVAYHEDAGVLIGRDRTTVVDAVSQRTMSQIESSGALASPPRRGLPLLSV